MLAYIIMYPPSPVWCLSAWQHWIHRPPHADVMCEIFLQFSDGIQATLALGICVYQWGTFPTQSFLTIIGTGYIIILGQPSSFLGYKDNSVCGVGEWYYTLWPDSRRTPVKLLVILISLLYRYQGITSLPQAVSRSASYLSALRVNAWQIQGKSPWFGGIWYSVPNDWVMFLYLIPYGRRHSPPCCIQLKVRPIICSWSGSHPLSWVDKERPCILFEDKNGNQW